MPSRQDSASGREVGSMPADRTAPSSRREPPPVPEEPSAQSDASGPTLLLPQHRDLLAASAIADDVVNERGYRSVTTKARLTDLGFTRPQARVPALLIPIHG